MTEHPTKCALHDRQRYALHRVSSPWQSTLLSELSITEVQCSPRQTEVCTPPSELSMTEHSTEWALHNRGTVLSMTDRGMYCTECALYDRASHWVCSPWQTEVCTPPSVLSMTDRGMHCKCALHDRAPHRICSPCRGMHSTECALHDSQRYALHRVCSPWQPEVCTPPSELSMTARGMHSTERELHWWAHHDRQGYALHWVCSLWQRTSLSLLSMTDRGTYRFHRVCSPWQTEVCTALSMLCHGEHLTDFALHDRQSYALHRERTSLSELSMTEVCTALSVLSITEHPTEFALHDRQRYKLH